MKKVNFKMRNVIAMVICFATVTIFSSCDKDKDPSIDPNAPAFTAFSILGQSASINAQSKTLTVTVACGTNLAALTPEFTLTPEGTTAKVNSTAQTSGETAVNCTSPVVYTLATADGQTTAQWTLTVKLPDDCPTAKKYITYNQPVKAYLIEYNGGAIAANRNNNAGNSGTVLEAYENKKYADVHWRDEWRCNVVNVIGKEYFSWDEWNNNSPNVWMEWDDQAGADGWRDGRWLESEYPLDRFAFCVSKRTLGGGFLWTNQGGLNDLADVARHPDEATMPNNTDVTQYYLRSEKVCNIMCDVFKISTATFWVDPATGFTLKLDVRDAQGNLEDGYEVTRLIVGTPNWDGEHLHYNAAAGDTYITP